MKGAGAVRAAWGGPALGHSGHLWHARGVGHDDPHPVGRRGRLGADFFGVAATDRRVRRVF